MLLGLVHEGADGGLSVRLAAPVVGGVQVGEAPFAHERPHHRGGGGARHAGERVDVHDPVVAAAGAVDDAGNAQTGLGGDVEGEHVRPFQDFLQVADFVIRGDIDAASGALEDLFLNSLLVEQADPEGKNLLDGALDLGRAEQLQAQPQLFRACRRPS